MPDADETAPLATASLLERLRRVERAALDHVALTYAVDLRRAARRLGFGGSDADDITHATWETFLRVAAEFRGEAQISTFLRGILRRKAAEFRRARRRHAGEVLDAIEGSVASAETSPEEAVEHAQTRAKLDDCVGALPPRERLAVTHRALREEPGEEVARRLAVTAEHLRVLLHRARHHLLDCMHAGGG